MSDDGAVMAAGLDTQTRVAAGPTRLFGTHLRWPGNNRLFAVTRDGQRFLVPQLSEEGPITVMLNWPAMLEK